MGTLSTHGFNEVAVIHHVDYAEDAPDIVDRYLAAVRDSETVEVGNLPGALAQRIADYTVFLGRDAAECEAGIAHVFGSEPLPSGLAMYKVYVDRRV